MLCHVITSHHIRGVKMLDNRVVPWFPKDVAELDLVANKTLEAGVDIESDHPGFLDQGKALSRLFLTSSIIPCTSFYL